MTNDNQPQVLTPDLLKVDPDIPVIAEEQEVDKKSISLDQVGITPQELGGIAWKLMQIMRQDKAGAMEIQGGFRNEDGKEFAYSLNVIITALAEVPAVPASTQEDTEDA